MDCENLCKLEFSQTARHAFLGRVSPNQDCSVDLGRSRTHSDAYRLGLSCRSQKRVECRFGVMQELAGVGKSKVLVVLIFELTLELSDKSPAVQPRLERKVERVTSSYSLLHYRGSPEITVFGLIAPRPDPNDIFAKYSEQARKQLVARLRRTSEESFE